MSLLIAPQVSGGGSTLDGVTVTGTPTTGEVLTATSGTAADWHNPASGFSNPMTTSGDIIYENSTPVPARLAGNATATKQYLEMTSSHRIKHNWLMFRSLSWNWLSEASCL